MPLKCKLTVSTQNSILDPWSFREWRIEAQVSSFNFRGSRTKIRRSSFEFWDTRIFRGSRTEILRKQLILENKTIAMNKAIDERLYLRKLTRCWMYANISSCCAFSTRHMPFAYLHWSWWQQTSLPSKCVYNVSPEMSDFFLRDKQPGASVLFSFARL